MAWRFVDDRATLDGATNGTLRTHFNQWVAETARKEQPRADMTDGDIVFTPRYSLFIHVDKNVLQSVVDRPNIEDFHHDDTGLVNLVDARWTPASDYDIDEDDEAEYFEPIDGCTEENVGWMRISTWMLGSVAYARFQNPNLWYVLYKDPQR